MKKTIKFLAVCSVLGIAMLAPLSAQRYARPNQPEPNQNFQRSAGDFFDYCGHFHTRGMAADDDVIIGKIRAIDQKSNTVRIADTDGKEFSVLITPFSKITECDKNHYRQNPVTFLDQSDLQRGDWVIVRLFDTDTKTAVACHIGVYKNRISREELENAK